MRTLFPWILSVGCVLVAACGGGGNDNGGADTTAPTATVTPADAVLGIHEALVITFSEPMDPASLQLEGSVIDFAAPAAWSSGNTVLTLAPQEGAWESGKYAVTVNAQDTSGNALGSVAIEKQIRLQFTNFQGADIVIGQPDFESALRNQTGSLTDPGANTLLFPYGKAVLVDGRLYLPDAGNHRVLGFNAIPTVNNAPADFVLGQATFSTNSPDKYSEPASLASDGASLVIGMDMNVVGYGEAPQTGPVQDDDVTFNLGGNAACAPSALGYEVDVAIGGGKLLVVDAAFNRVLVWNTAHPQPGTLADLVLGQPTLSSCAANSDVNGAGQATPSAGSLHRPRSAWTDGTRVVIADSDNSRVLIWNTFPTSDQQPADVVVGQGDFAHAAANDADQNGVEGAPSANTISASLGVASNGVQLFVTDELNHRLLIWNTFPTANFQPADVVLGQDDFVSGMPNDPDQNGSTNASPSAATFRYPAGITLYRDRMLVSDAVNNRYLIFKSN